ncbi:unnamed protein product [Dibothriocephalus latus]|uniref:Uncharacterized protein n=1 Tax=Dibothriocephalus latus TaxID=60516 RepID=A0A3P7NI02_DIBLA|nr:unnamed protein product [Dibothriocephalus latus]
MQPRQQSLLGDSGILAGLQANIAAAQNAVCEIAVGLRLPALTSWKFPHRLALSLPIGQLLTGLRYDPASLITIYLEAKSSIQTVSAGTTFQTTSPIEICSCLVKILRSFSSANKNTDETDYEINKHLLNDLHTDKDEKSKPPELSFETWRQPADIDTLDAETQTVSETTERPTEARDFIDFFPMGREYALCAAGLAEMSKLPFAKLRRALDCDVKRLLQSLANANDEQVRAESRLQANLQELEKAQSTLATLEETFRKRETALKRQISELKRQMEETAKRVSTKEQDCLDLTQKLRNTEYQCKTTEAELDSAKRSLGKYPVLLILPLFCRPHCRLRI